MVTRTRDLGTILVATWFLSCPTFLAVAAPTPRFAPHEETFTASGAYANPYTECAAEVELVGPGGATPRTLPLFWDGGATWKFRFSPREIGLWRWTVRSADAGLNGRSGRFECAPGDRAGGLQPMPGFPRHFARADGSPFWFVGDTAWSLFTDNAEGHNRAAALDYLDTRAAQGFTVVHSMLLSEVGDGNEGGPPFAELGAECINPAYWREVDLRVAHANGRGLVCGLALAWGNKRNSEKWPWGRFPNLAARTRYARYVAARYSAYDVYFLVSGEWHAEIRTRRGATEDAVRREFIAVGDALRAADPHGRMVGIHPMTARGSVREFNAAPWMSFGDYQQNYSELHARVLESMRYDKPVVNSEYGYFLRDSDNDGVPDKDNSFNDEDMRAASWDIVMAGGYVVTGFGTTYLGGHRDPGPFALHAEKNRVWERQMSAMRRFFTGCEWWRLAPHDELVTSETPRGKDRQRATSVRKLVRPPAVAYWCLAAPGRVYVVYARGLRAPVRLALDARSATPTVQQFNPRTAEAVRVNLRVADNHLLYQPPNDEDWVVLVNFP